MRAPYRNDHDALMARLVALLDDLEGLRSKSRELGDVTADTRRVEREIDGLRREIARVAPTRLPLLDRVSVAAPCPADWNAMSGDERARYCGQCEKHVYNIAGMTSEEAEGLLRRASGEVCIRIYRRADGTVLTSDCPVGVKRRRRRRAVASLAFGSALAAGAGALLTAARPPAPVAGNMMFTAGVASEAPTQSPVDQAPTTRPEVNVPTGGAPPPMPRETKIEAEMAHVRSVLEKRAKMTNPADLGTAEAEIRAARERIKALSRAPH
jgi:hypothetical protein